MYKCSWYAVLSILLISLIPISAVGCINVTMPGSSNVPTPGTATDEPTKVYETTLPVVAVLPTIESFSATPATITSGKSSTLSWSVKDATSVMIAPNIGTVPATGNKEVKLYTPVTYLLTASNHFGTSYGQVTIQVTSPGTKPGNLQLQPAGFPTIWSFSASPETITAGGSSTLNWSVKDATSIMIVPEIGSVSATGSKTVKPSTATMYTLVASNASGMLSKSITVNVLSAQVVKPELQVVNKKPDLLFYPSSLGIDEVNRIIYTMKNGGQGKSAPCINALFVDGIWVATSNINYSLNPGNFVTLTIGGTLLPSPLEPHVFEVRLDAYYTNDESNENNNSRSASFNYKLK